MTQKSKKHFDLYLKQLSYSTEEEKEFIKENLTVKTLNKDDYFLKFGEVQSDMGFVCEGLIRRFYINEKGSNHF